jgi:hypothetical protein
VNALDSVVVVTTGHRYELGHVPAGGRRTVRVQVTDESHIELVHGRGERRHLVVETYFGPGYRGTVHARVRVDTVLAVESAV